MGTNSAPPYSAARCTAVLGGTQPRVKIAIDLPETYRTALTMGSWDSTALLRADLDQVKQTAKKLAYMSNFAG